MSNFSRQIRPEDIPDTIEGQLTFSDLEKWSNLSEENYAILDIEDAAEESKIRTPEEFVERYDIGLDTATKLAKYQHAALNDLDLKINNLVSSSERYAQVKTFLNDPRYNRSILFEYVALWHMSRRFTEKKYNPTSNLRNELILGLISYALLGIFIASTLLFLDGNPIYDNLPALLVAFVWGYYTTRMLGVKVVKNYRTRKLVFNLYKTHH